MPITFEQSKDAIIRLVKQFEGSKGQYLDRGHKEAHTRQFLIDPLFVALGWDVHNQQGLSPDESEVFFEGTQEIEGQKKAPDYVFRKDRKTVFFAEAKKPTVDLKGGIGPAYQLRRYAWSASLPLSLLTDFEEMAIYDCRIRPAPTDKATVARVNYLTYQEYPDRWREIWDVFSREAVWSGAFEQYTQTAKAKRGTSPVDKEFLKEIEGWRDVLARNLALRNSSLSIDDLNDAVQRTIDRIIFLRMAEDRGIEDYERLKRLAAGDNIYQGLVTLFRHADARYNSGLFDFSKVSGSGGDTLTPGLKIDDKTLKPILTSLYFPESPYEFSVLPVEILGNVYEQFLGKVIRLTPAHQAKIEEKPEVKKAGGVYYTPAYIVEYIVKNTVGVAVAGKTPQQLRGFRVLDPACGSGSFLLGAYQHLMDYYLAWYTANAPEKHAKAVWHASRGEAWRLTTAEKKRILTEHIFGVDIDRQAVEVTKLSLLLKVLETESDKSLGSQLALIQEEAKARALPNLDRNIKCGNSLIGPDYFSGQLISDDDELKSVNPFDWAKEFPDAMRAGGFDCVIGNPPYVLLQSLNQPQIFEHFAKTYRTATYKIDTYQVFFEKGLSLVCVGGYFGFITPNTFLRNKHAKALRKLILEKADVELLRVFFYKVFDKASVDTSIIVLRRTDKPDLERPVQIISSKSPLILSEANQQPQRAWHEHPEYQFGLPGASGTSEVITKIQQRSSPLGDFATAYFGIQTFDRKKYVRTSSPAKRFKPVVDGGHITRYALAPGTEFVDFQPDAIKSGGKQIVYEQERIGVRQIGEAPVASLLPAGLYTLNTIYNIFFTRETNYKLTFILGALSSRLLQWYWKQSFFDQKETFPKVKKDALLAMPIAHVNFFNPTDKAQHDQMVKHVEQMLDLHKRLAASQSAGERERLQRLIESTDQQIDTLVYELYGLTPEEIAIVEGRES